MQDLIKKWKTYMKPLFNFLLFVLTTTLFISCNTTEPPIITPPPPDLRKITLTFEDASCTEVWLKIKADSLTLPAELMLKQYNPTGDSLSKIFVLNTQDTVLYIDSLLPNQTYNYQAVLTADTTIKSEKVTAQTLEPTSHNFTWQTFEFGQHSSSVLYDVAIIDENNIWAVGAIYMNDSLGNPDPIPYSIAKWDGVRWELKKIFYNINSIIAPIRGILILNSNEIYIAAGSVFRWDGISSLAQMVYSRLNLPDPNATIEKLWGISSNTIFGVGNVGTLVYCSGNTWTKLESGTTLDLTDIYGDTDGNVYAAGVDISYAKGVVVKGNNSGSWEVMIEGEIIDESQLFDKLFGKLGTLWVDEIGTLYAGADFLYQFKNSKWDFVRSLPENYLGGDQYYIGYLYSIRGNKSNDIIVAGDRNTLRHFNGIDWAEIGIPYNPYRSIFWRSVRIKDNLSVAVGDEGIQAKIIMLKR